MKLLNLLLLAIMLTVQGILSDWTREVFFTVINERYNWMRPIIVSTNLSLREIADSYGDRMASRLYEMSEIQKVTGEDRRLKGKNAK